MRRLAAESGRGKGVVFTSVKAILAAESATSLPGIPAWEGTPRKAISQTSMNESPATGMFEEAHARAQQAVDGSWPVHSPPQVLQAMLNPLLGHLHPEFTSLISVTCPIAPVPLRDPPKRRCFWHFNSAKWEDLRQYYSDFPWNDYCFHVKDPSLCAERITEVIVSGMEAYIPLTFSNPKARHLGLTLPVLMLSEIERWLTNGTIMDEVKEGLRYLFQTKSEVVCCVSGTGHAGMEATMCNLLEPNDVILIAQNGIWGERAAEMACRHEADVRTVKKPAGDVFHLDELEAALKEHKPAVLFLVQAESSTGALQPIYGVGALCQKYGALLAVDAVASLGGVPFFMDQWGVDVVYTGTQKVISAPPSLAPIAFSHQAMYVFHLSSGFCLAFE
ncbi:Serine--pyruvate aminotransferase, mitochondrial [Chionoecetes opilio]|uniref:Serine--pyruvate aminotransferase, mitochondrial n=1 Tax=Chionoecetes opilio TaxID=41210 RepID=A0A8J5D3H7_CHIOP|nr:Serine--pyruvate aminotransferase, mitochondrial [Chionoecetes opilio]